MRQKILVQLKIAYGETLTQQQMVEIAKGVFINQAWHFVDYVHTIRYKTREQFSKIVDIVGEDNLKREYDKGKGVICLFNHCGPWELAVVILPSMGYETSASSRPMPNPRIDKLIVHYRESRGMKNIGRTGKSYPTLIDTVNRGECLIIMIDQDTQVKGVYIDFFGKTAFTPIGAARLALDTEAAVVPVHLKRMPNNRYEFRFKPAIPTIRTGSYDNDVLENTKRYTKAIEDIVRDSPEQWVWMHERWRTTPEIEKEWLEFHKLQREREKEHAEEQRLRAENKRLRREKFRSKALFWQRGR